MKLARLFVGLTVAFHSLIVILNILSAVFVMIKGPYWLIVPVWTCLLNVVFTPVQSCPLTVLENYFRRKAGMPEINIFLEHYFGLRLWNR